MYATLVNISYSVLLLKQLTGAKLMFIKHNLVPGKTDIYHRWINAQVDAFVCVSKLVYDDLMTPAIMDTSKYHVVYNGIDPTDSSLFRCSSHEV